jgi:hypothetical protein
MQHIKLFFSWLYTLNHYHGCEKLTLWDYLYKKRVGIRTAWAMAKAIFEINNPSPKKTI